VNVKRVDSGCDLNRNGEVSLDLGRKTVVRCAEMMT